MGHAVSPGVGVPVARDESSFDGASGEDRMRLALGGMASNHGIELDARKHSPGVERPRWRHPSGVGREVMPSTSLPSNLDATPVIARSAMTTLERHTEQTERRRSSFQRPRGRQGSETRPPRVALVALLLGALALAMGSALASGSDRTGFPAWHQEFEQNVDGWIGGDVESAAGWCGTVEHRPSADGTVDPASGDGYAVAIGGPCNAFYQEQGFPPNGPYSYGEAYSTSFPSGGFAVELDAYLDPEQHMEFTFWSSFSRLDVRDEPGPPSDDDPEGDFGNWISSLRYQAVPVEAGGGDIVVGDGELTGAEHRVDEAGWYTFRHSFTEAADGSVNADFELARDGEVLFTASPDTAYTPEGAEGPAFPLSEIEAENVGTGYVWLDLSDGTELPIDRHRVRTLAP